MTTMERDRYNPDIWVIRRDGQAVRRGKGRLWGRLWLAWERRGEGRRDDRHV